MEFNKETQTLKETQTSKETQTLKRYMEFNKETQALKETQTLKVVFFFYGQCGGKRVFFLRLRSVSFRFITKLSFDKPLYF